MSVFSEPPSFNDKKCSGDATVPEKHSAKFICSVNGYPNPNISWKREDDKIISANVKEGNSNGLASSLLFFESDLCPFFPSLLIGPFQICFSQTSRLSYFGELPDVVLPKIAQKRKNSQ